MSGSKLDGKERRLEQPEDVLRWIGEIIQGLGKLPVAAQNFPHKSIFDAPNGRDLFFACHRLGWVEGVTSLSANLSAIGADVLRKLESAEEDKRDRVSPTTMGRWVQRLDRWAARQERYFPSLARPLFRLLWRFLAILGWILAGYFALVD